MRNHDIRDRSKTNTSTSIYTKYIPCKVLAIYLSTTAHIPFTTIHTDESDQLPKISLYQIILHYLVITKCMSRNFYLNHPFPFLKI